MPDDTDFVAELMGVALQSIYARLAPGVLKEFGQLKTNADRVSFVDKIPCVHETLVIEPEFSGKSEGTMCTI
ncbi:hypothetical protein NP493_922g00000 [Ridgeia piscesae]|uniref:Uncharacterized protein n=1 Tax=Ridgeia piscesae TaxID=27915 RepID=A0AAD9NLN5_RIDPI|nr:hypothetical protein NP493_922g00000 [Ridgeia piscesae]